MKVEIHHYHHADPNLERKLDQLLAALATQGVKIMGLLDTVAADVTAETNASQAMKTVLATVAQELKDLQASAVNNTIDPAALKVITDKLEANTADIVAGTLANTPAAPPQ